MKIKKIRPEADILRELTKAKTRTLCGFSLRGIRKKSDATNGSVFAVGKNTESANGCRRAGGLGSHYSTRSRAEREKAEKA